MHFRRITFAAAAVAAVSLALAGCSSSSSTGTATTSAGSGGSTTSLTSDGQPVNILIPTGTFQKIIQPLLASFTASTGIKVDETAETIPDLQSAELLDLTQKTGTYDSIVMDDSWLTQFKSDLLPLQALVKKDDVKVSGFFPALTKIFNQDGNQYSYPFGTSPWLLVYNSKVLSAAGITPPTTFAQLETDAAKLTANGQHGFVVPLEDPGTLTTVWYQYAVNAGLKSFLNSSGTKANLVNKPSEEALTLFEKMYKSGSIPSDAITYDAGGALTSVESGESAMGILPMSNLYDVNSPAESKLAGDFNIAANPVASSSETSQYLTTGWGIGISKYSKNQAGAWKLEKYLIDAFQNPTAASPSGIVRYPNSTASLQTTAVQQTYPGNAIAVVKSTGANPVIRPITPYYQAVAIAIGTDIQSVFTGKSTVKAALEQAQSDADKILK